MRRYARSVARMISELLRSSGMILVMRIAPLRLPTVAGAELPEDWA